MVLDAEVTVDDLHSEAVVEAVAGSEAEATTEGEDAVQAAATRMEEGEAAVYTTESVLSLTSYSECFNSFFSNFQMSMICFWCAILYSHLIR